MIRDMELLLNTVYDEKSNLTYLNPLNAYSAN